MKAVTACLLISLCLCIPVTLQTNSEALCNERGECSSGFVLRRTSTADTFDPSKATHTTFSPSVLKRLRVPKQYRLSPNPAAVHGRSRKRSLRTEVYAVDDFLSAAESAALISLHKQRNAELSSTPRFCFESLYTLQRHLEDVGLPFRDVNPATFVEGTTCVNASLSLKLSRRLRYSISTSFYVSELPFASALHERIQALTGLKGDHGGKFMLTSYEPGVGYRTHHDCSVHGSSPVDRFATALVYLNSLTSDQGGQTVFPALDINVEARQGRLLVWNSMDRLGRCLPESVHFAEDVDSEMGHTKYILQRWYYYQSFPGLGQRFREPAEPRRPANTAQVFCDDYDTGSCRQYDEWTSNHLIAWRHAQP